MFTGIVEFTGQVTALQEDKGNLNITASSPFSDELRIDQSVAHNGVCLTIVSLDEHTHTVTAVEETLQKSNLGALAIGDFINLERCMQMNGRLDGHIVQGHVDQTAICIAVNELEGSWFYTFEYDSSTGNVTVEKGSICVNGVSLTVVNSEENQFSIAIIPYTHEHTNFKQLKQGDTVNLEFDIIGKYVARLLNK
ncbi:Riboflavin synthase eubacterial/eukaryotic [Arcticibacter svalbardensis MN12-7]|uniref:Riboflavin synthase n=1 Tax=Arcticibacter svalbardensis MN12-7 TaxID=1150600 RepID=R9H0M9_9SPHI|nr:riboflavin synthase [Arcticibacter svalbardensis]EOR94774.1 Riboflavin synthase eubacterial/eukaryotic [Arcticibacter svalbardensis MN12-7]